MVEAESRVPPTVLVAEDEPAMLSLVARYLRGMGLSVVEASEGDAAWELTQIHHPDLVLLDVMMPGMSGWEVCKRIKGHGAGGPLGRTGVIMLTGIGENLNDMTSPLFAADAWLNKPFDFADLDARVRETLSRYRNGYVVNESSTEQLAQAGVPTPANDDVVEDEAWSEEPKKTKALPRTSAARSPTPKKAKAKRPAKKRATPKTAARKPPAKRAPKKTATPKKAARKPPAKRAPKKTATPKKAAKKTAPKKAAKKTPEKRAPKRAGAAKTKGAPKSTPKKAATAKRLTPKKVARGR